MASVLLSTDPIRAWLDAGIHQLRSSEAAAAAEGSSADFTASRAFVEDFRVHKVLDWLQHRHWRHIRSDRRLLPVQVCQLRPQPEPQTLDRSCVPRQRTVACTVAFGLGQQAVLAAHQHGISCECKGCGLLLWRRLLVTQQALLVPPNLHAYICCCPVADDPVDAAGPA